MRYENTDLKKNMAIVVEALLKVMVSFLLDSLFGGCMKKTLLAYKIIRECGRMMSVR